MAARRKKVSEMRLAGATISQMADVLGVATSTIINDVRAIKEDASIVQLERTLTEQPDILEAVSDNTDGKKLAVVEAALEGRATAQQIAKEQGITIKQVNKWVNEALSEIGDYGGRTLDEWRTQDLITVERRIRQLEEDARQQEVPELNEDGNPTGNWLISPSRAAQIRASAGKVLIEMMHYRAKLMGLYQQKQEIEITRNAVVQIRGVNLSSFPMANELASGDVVEGEFS